jgi:hypothetical protein
LRKNFYKAELNKLDSAVSISTIQGYSGSRGIS